MRLFDSPRAPRFALIAALGAAPLLFAPAAQAGWSAQPFLPPTVGQGESVKVALAPSGAVAFATKNRNIPSQLHAGSITPDGQIVGTSLIAEGGGDMAIHAAPDGGRNVWWRTSSPVDIASAHINPIGEVSQVFRHGAAGVSLPVSAVDGAGTVTVAWLSNAGLGFSRISAQGGATGSATLYTTPAGSTRQQLDVPLRRLAHRRHRRAQRAGRQGDRERVHGGGQFPDLANGGARAGTKEQLAIGRQRRRQDAGIVVRAREVCDRPGGVLITRGVEADGPNPHDLRRGVAFSPRDVAVTGFIGDDERRAERSRRRAAAC